MRSDFFTLSLAITHYILCVLFNSSFLIRPIQHVPRYKLFAQKVLKILPHDDDRRRAYEAMDQELREFAMYLVRRCMLALVLPFLMALLANCIEVSRGLQTAAGLLYAVNNYYHIGCSYAQGIYDLFVVAAETTPSG